MIVEITYPYLSSLRWYKQGQQFLYKGLRMLQVDGIWVEHFVIDTTNGEDNIPNYVGAILDGYDPKGEIQSPLETMYENLSTDPTKEILGKNDAVLAAKVFLGQDIAAKDLMDQADYDQRRLALIVPKDHPGVVPVQPVVIGINENPPAETIPPEDRTNEFDNELSPEFT